jgi:UDP-2-acetamido-2,6-beta-L-arabino-hexul-4-ose reductase
MSVEMDHILVHSDARGVVFEPLELEMIAAQRNTHVVISNPGVVRGNHYHLQGTETIAVVGPALVRIRGNGSLRDIKVPEEKVYRFTFPPKIPHAINNTGNRVNILVAYNSCEHDPRNPDTIQEILIEGGKGSKN